MKSLSQQLDSQSQPRASSSGVKGVKDILKRLWSSSQPSSNSKATEPTQCNWQSVNGHLLGSHWLYLSEER